MGADLSSSFLSHTGKLLQDHLKGVALGVRKRTLLRTAEIAAIFHDLGKINPNFQLKLAGKTVNAYSGHAYLSALAWLCFCKENRELVKELIGEDQLAVFSVTAMIARHHGNLPDFEEGIFKPRPRHDLKAFLKGNPALPISDFLQILQSHKSFYLDLSDQVLDKVLNVRLLPDQIKKPLDFFFNTQFGFACLIESDKRDAGNNKEFNREKIGEYFRSNFAARLLETLSSLRPTRPLDTVRTRIREEVVSKLGKGDDEHEQKHERLFTLSAPTGAGKTLILLSLAAEILKENPDHGVIYALPFLSITEQVESVCKSLFPDNNNAVLRIDSKSENERITEAQKQLDEDPSKLSELLRESFSENTFDHPFIITTFVQIFESLVSNRNATLLRLPNFARSIFLIDEVQALPPRLYIFFTALLDEFCRRFDSYAIISTATMPYFELPEKDLPENENPKKLFGDYQKPRELLPDGKYYQRPEFNRYRICWLKNREPYIYDLFEGVVQQDDPCLIILNTIDDTKQLYERLKEEDEIECHLLNTHFTLNDRRYKIERCKAVLDSIKRDPNEKKKRLILISTQLIEAGVDIDFPILFRDLCPLPNLIQSAGRCNRNGEWMTGIVYLFELKKENGKPSSSLIYRDEGRNFLDFCKRHIADTVTEAELLTVQRKFFEFVGKNLTVGLHKQAGNELHLIKLINRAGFEQLGRFRLIDDSYFGSEYRYYIPQSEIDEEFEKLSELAGGFQGRRAGFEEAKRYQLEIEQQIRKMSGNIVTFRLPVKIQDMAPPYGGELMGIRKLARLEDYSNETGINLQATGGFII